MNRSKLLLLTFIVTSIWNVALQFITKSYKEIPKAIRFNFFKYINEYFRNHSILEIATISGFTGMVIQLVIITIMKFPREWSVTYIVTFLVLSFIISGAAGYIIQASKLYPDLKENYYNKMAPLESFILDGSSAICIQIVLIILYSLKDSIQ